MLRLVMLAAHMTTTLAAGDGLYDPLPPHAYTGRLKNHRPARCAFVTAGPQTYAGALNCLSRRLNGSRYPLITFVPSEDEETMRPQLQVNSHPKSMILPWNRFPYSSHDHGDSIRGARVMDKMNMLGLASVARKIVWIDSDVYLRSSLDELCELPHDISFAFTHASKNGRPVHAWPSGKENACTAGYNSTMDMAAYTFLRPQTTSSCAFMFNAGLVVFNPMHTEAFNELVVKPVSNGSVAGYVHSEQGMMNTLLYDARKGFSWKASYAVLHPRFNTIARFLPAAEKLFGQKAVGVHWTGGSGRPWLPGAKPPSDVLPAVWDEWQQHC